MEYRAGTPEGARDLAARGVAHHEDSIEHHRLYQDAVLEVGDRDELVAEYTARRDADESSANAAYLLARIERRMPGEAQYLELVQRFPEHAYLARAHLFDRIVAGDYPGAVDAAKSLRKLNEPMFFEVLEAVSVAMVATGAA